MTWIQDLGGQIHDRDSWIVDAGSHTQGQGSKEDASANEIQDRSVMIAGLDERMASRLRSGQVCGCLLPLCAFRVIMLRRNR